MVIGDGVVVVWMIVVVGGMVVEVWCGVMLVWLDYLGFVVGFYVEGVLLVIEGWIVVGCFVK